MVEYDAETIDRIERATGGRFWAYVADGILVEQDFEYVVHYTHEQIERLIREDEQ